jgi:ABC-type iron transport system FetAB permease component
MIVQKWSGLMRRCISFPSLWAAITAIIELWSIGFLLSNVLHVHFHKFVFALAVL